MNLDLKAMELFVRVAASVPFFRRIIKLLECALLVKYFADATGHYCIAMNVNRASNLRDQTGQRSKIRINGDSATRYEEPVSEAALVRSRIAPKLKGVVLDYFRDGHLISVLNNYRVKLEWSIWATHPTWSPCLGKGTDVR
jgi:hypothetical protein|tara:strand:- start:3815 stop:4237 length:423 start_codon:yes stop_codon:yes gene_type:complete